MLCLRKRVHLSAQRCHASLFFLGVVIAQTAKAEGQGDEGREMMGIGEEHGHNKGRAQAYPGEQRREDGQEFVGITRFLLDEREQSGQIIVCIQVENCLKEGLHRLSLPAHGGGPVRARGTSRSTIHHKRPASNVVPVTAWYLWTAAPSPFIQVRQTRHGVASA